MPDSLPRVYAARCAQGFPPDFARRARKLLAGNPFEPMVMDMETGRGTEVRYVGVLDDYTALF
ncbi:hypothetical protein [Nocardia sp. NPDC057455]|uniref:hypothetical protein n=1 Tax=Nocardia sp. NPDC057455 TaxID=3346138 RepID=UPI00366AA0CB